MVDCIAQNKDKIVTKTAKACKKTKPSQKKKKKISQYVYVPK